MLFAYHFDHFFNIPHCFFCHDFNRTTTSFFINNFWMPLVSLYKSCLKNSKLKSHSWIMLPPMSRFGNSLLVVSVSHIGLWLSYWLFLEALCISCKSGNILHEIYLHITRIYLHANGLLIFHGLIIVYLNITKWFLFFLSVSCENNTKMTLLLLWIKLICICLILILVC